LSGMATGSRTVFIVIWLSGEDPGRGQQRNVIRDGNRRGSWTCLMSFLFPQTLRSMKVRGTGTRYRNQNYHKFKLAQFYTIYDVTSIQMDQEKKNRGSSSDFNQIQICASTMSYCQRSSTLEFSGSFSLRFFQRRAGSNKISVTQQTR
jgi:hypothetical protein